MGISVSVEEVAAAIQRESYFLDENGRFDRHRYYQILQSNQLTPEQFELSQKEQILMQKIHSILEDSFLYTNDDINEYAGFLNRELKATYVVIDPQKYEANVKFSDDDLKNFYENHRDQYDHPERAKARHILLGLTGSESLLDEEKAKKSLEDYRNQILAGKAAFNDLAAKYSQDGGSKNKGGELGWITRGITVKEFEDAVFSLKKGEISKPFKTKYGYHIVQLEEYEKPYKSTFNEVHLKITKQYQKEKAFEKILTLSELLVNKLKENSDLEKAGKNLNLSVGNTTWFNRGTSIPNLKDSEDIADTLAGLYPGEWKGPLSLNQKEYFFQIVDARIPKEDKQKKSGEHSDVAQRLFQAHQALWLKSFLDSERKKLNVKSYLNG